MGRRVAMFIHSRGWPVAIATAMFAALAMLGPARAEAAPGSITGAVTNGSGVGLEGICVAADGVGNPDSGDAETAADGTYGIGGLDPGNYVVQFVACGPEDFVSEYYDDKGFVDATKVQVTDGGTMSGIDAELADGGGLSGVVTAQGTGTPLAGVCVTVNGPTSESTQTNVLGQYSVGDLAPGSYTVSFDGCAAGNFVSEHYDDVEQVADADSVTVLAHATTTGISAVLAHAGSISGSVTDTEGTARPGVCVIAHRVGSSVTHTAETNASGAYQVTRLPTGSYKVQFQDCNGLGLVGEFWNDKADQASANAVSVAAPTDTPGIDAQLAIDPGATTGTISGQVTNEDLNPLSNICVTAHPDNPSGVPGFDTTNGSGDYEITGLAPDDYKIEFSACHGGPYFTEYYDNQTDFDMADPVFIGAAETADGIDAQLAADPNVDITPPAAPTFTASNPTSPGKSNSPRLLGTAETGSTVRVYKSSNCTGTPVSDTAAQFSSPGIQTSSLPDNSSTTFTATATDVAGNTSGCSATFTYVEDSNAPAAPSLTGTTPASPSNDNNPEVNGSAESGSTVQVYLTANCSGSMAATGGAAVLAGPGLTVAVTPNATTTLSATATDAAGNVSPCSSTLTYVEDSTAPPKPTLAIAPASPANDNNPQVTGSAQNGSTVRLYRTSDCSGTPVDTLTPAELASPGFTATVANNSTTSFSANATDGVGNASTCSDPLTYIEDSAAPSTPSLTSTDPASPGSANNPKVKGTAEDGSTVRLYTTSDCSGTPAATRSAAELAGAGIAVNVGADSTTNFRATATDAAGNVSPCSAPRTYVEDSTPPGAPSLTGVSPTSPANDNQPRVKGTADGGTTVRFFLDTCSGSPIGSGTASQLAGTGIQVTVPSDDVSNLRAQAADPAGNASGCSNTVQYVEDSTAPPAPSLTSTDPASPANDNNPEVKGTAENGSTVHLYTTNDCSGTPVATGTPAQFAGAGITVNVGANSTTNFRATATDAVGNTSACSSPQAYVEDSTAPAAPSLTSTDPASPGSANDPKVKGSAENGSTVRLYTTSDCSGTPVAIKSAAELASPGIAANVANNSTTVFRATATDAAGNASPCSAALQYVEDSNAPAAPSLTGTTPGSPSDDDNPEVRGSAESGSTVRIYRSADCSGSPAATGGAATLAGAGITVAVPSNATTTLSATATDAAGNVSPCSPTLNYVEVSAEPPPPPPPPGDGGGTGGGTGGDGTGGGGTFDPPAQCVVPSVKGMSTADAESALEEARCALGDVTTKKVKKGKSGKVLAQAPSAGQTLPAGTEVSVTVSKVKKKRKKK